ncbi:unnamed protein product, partial [Dovyalis caffra]
RVSSNNIITTFVPANDELIDIFAKRLTSSQFARIRANLCILESHAQIAKVSTFKKYMFQNEMEKGKKQKVMERISYTPSSQRMSMFCSQLCCDCDNEFGTEEFFQPCPWRN